MISRGSDLFRFYIVDGSDITAVVNNVDPSLNCWRWSGIQAQVPNNIGT